MHILRYSHDRCDVAVPISILSAWTELRLLSTVFAQLVRAQRAGARTVSWLTVIVESAITAGWQR